MSDTPDQIAPGVKRIEDEAAAWFDRKYFWTWDDADQLALDNWLSQSPAHEIAYWRLEAGWVRAERMAALRRPGRRNPAISGRRVLPTVARVAAGLLVVGLLGLAATSFTPKAKQTFYATAIGEHRIVVLPDGSKVELNTNSLLRIAFDGRQRQAFLDRGEAFFDIKHDAGHPFRVMAAGRRVTDIGTKFLLRLDAGNRLVMALTEGGARLDVVTVDAVHRQALLEPGDIAVATDTSLSLRKSTPREVRKSLEWTRGVLVFDRTTLGAAASEFNRYNKQKLVIESQAAAERTVSGTFQTTNIADFASLARDVLGLHVERTKMAKSSFRNKQAGYLSAGNF